MAKGEPAWKVIAPAFLKDAVTGAEPRQETWVKLTRTETELCVLFNASDTFIWATHTQRDAPLWEEEVVEIFLDPVGDFESYFEIEINPRNAICDLFLRRTRSGYRKCFAWHCEGLQTVVKMFPDSWTVEMTIPFASLGSELPREGHPWRANFCRIDRPQNSPRELSAWSPTGRPNFHVQSNFGWIDFV